MSPVYNNIELHESLPQMIELAEKLSKCRCFLRVDFYSVNSRIYFGELTLFPATGMGKFVPDKWDKTLGDWIDLGLVK